MNLKDWEKTLFNITKNTGDISTMMQYLDYAKYNEIKENEIQEAQAETYKDDDTLTR